MITAPFYAAMSQDLVTSDPQKRGGEPVFRGTRVPVDFLKQYLENGYTVEDFISEYRIDPDLVWKVYNQRFRDNHQAGEKVPA